MSRRDMMSDRESVRGLGGRKTRVLNAHVRAAVGVGGIWYAIGGDGLIREE